MEVDTSKVNGLVNQARADIESVDREAEHEEHAIPESRRASFDVL